MLKNLKNKSRQVFFYNMMMYIKIDVFFCFFLIQYPLLILNEWQCYCVQHTFFGRETSLACELGPSVPTSSTDFSFQNLVFWNLFEFSAAEVTQKSIILPHSESKSHQINSIKSCSSRSFPTAPKAHSNSSEIFSYDLI
jgi:hypothetical protein